MNAEQTAVQNVAKQELESQFRAMATRLPPIVCFANDWGGDPTSKHHIMRQFSRHVPVLWVESAGMRRPRLSSLADLRRIAARLKPAPARSSAGSQASTGNVRVISPLSIPLPGNRAAEMVNRRLYRRAVAKAGVAGDAPLLWVYTPTVAPYLDAIPHSGLVYHCVDRWWAFSEYDPAVMRRHHEALCRKADVVFASAAELLEDCRQFAPDAQLMPHGVDWDHFSRAAFNPPARPADIANVTGPIIGFFGLLHDWIDQDLLIRIADANPAATMVLIGKAPVDISRLVRHHNVRWLGQKPFAELPAYAAAFDVALVPFVRNDLTAAVNPIKLLEYLSAGVPVVATALPEIVRLSPRRGLNVAADANEFVAAVGDLLRRDSSVEERQAIAGAQAEDSWLGRC
ncbi:MAG TPA: glycosyltransferase, partial [Longimicrobiales bacterium]|nr:glycosyltransferase [Longimicrobiales bacterium]